LRSSGAILAGAAKIAGPQPFLDHMAEHHIPEFLLPLVMLLELRCCWAGGCRSWPVPLFCLATAFGFHLNLADKAERTLFIKDLAIAGALMVIAAHASVASKVADLGAITAAANR
jgi:putative oxidoreductase